MNPAYIYRFVRFCITAAAVIAGTMALLYLWRYTYPFVIAFFIAFLINPLVGFFQQKGKLPRGISVLLALLTIISLLAGLITLLITEIVSGANYLAEVVPQHIETLIDYIETLIATEILPQYNKFTAYFKSLDSGQQDTVMENIQIAGKKIATAAGDFIQEFFHNIPAILGWFPNAATVLVFSLLATFFISKDWNKLARLGNQILPVKVSTSSKRVFLDLKKALFGFIKAQFTLISITTVIVLIGLLVLRVDYAITIALVCGIVDILPYLGTGAVFVPWILFEAISGDVGLALGLGILYLVVLIQRQIMEPKVLSSSIGLDPLATLIALFIGFKTIGFLGLIVGPVILVVLSTLHRANVFYDLWAFIKGDEPAG
ncbi:sporulation integral membrane protein YtvI [Peribacillus deserti]|uniref:Sporulation integral membrane protein YtvI n=1 Tax=Peribacillus deserti TaxID=673318 RepID=A0A2N5M9Y9_9BACI|nr:sporulation integral membrane protein YtvI [Peribacillus deserti]PLT31180.1 sporulation integral membrane protein YtvI [Peribacillus deserti]